MRLSRVGGGCYRKYISTLDHCPGKREAMHLPMTAGSADLNLLSLIIATCLAAYVRQQTDGNGGFP
jgi:hypothetical protein